VVGAQGPPISSPPPIPSPRIHQRHAKTVKYEDAVAIARDVMGRTPPEGSTIDRGLRDLHEFNRCSAAGRVKHCCRSGRVFGAEGEKARGREEQESAAKSLKILIDLCQRGSHRGDIRALAARYVETNLLCLARIVRASTPRS